MDIPIWILPVLGSALGLGFYDLCKKHAVQKNSVMPTLFYATLCGSILFVLITIVSGKWDTSFYCPMRHWVLILFKSILVSSSWTLVYYAMRELPISIASPIRASSPLWTFIASLIIFQEIPTFLQTIGIIAIFGGYYLYTVFGKLEGFTFRSSKGMVMIIVATLLGACSALYDKYLLGVLHIPKETVQFWFSVDLVFVIGLGYAIRTFCFGSKHPFQWRWSIAATGILLIIADYLYFYAVSLPDAQISLISLVRRCNCIVTFAVGVVLFKEINIKRKAAALVLILAGVAILALAGK